MHTSHNDTNNFLTGRFLGSVGLLGGPQKSPCKPSQIIVVVQHCNQDQHAILMCNQPH